jgi:hypothetical protein
MTKFELNHSPVTPEKVRAAADRVEAVVGETLNVSIARLKKISLEDLALLVQHARNTTPAKEEPASPNMREAQELIDELLLRGVAPQHIINTMRGYGRGVAQAPTELAELAKAYPAR